MHDESTDTVTCWIDWDERYPVYELNEGEPRNTPVHTFRQLSVSREFFARYQRVMAEFDAMQGELDELNERPTPLV